MPRLIESVAEFLVHLGCDVQVREPQVVGFREIVGGRVTFAIRVEDRQGMSQMPASSVYEKRFRDGFEQLPVDTVRWVVVTRDAQQAAGRYGDFVRAMREFKISVGSFQDFLDTLVPRSQIARYLDRKTDTILHNVGYVPQHVADAGANRLPALDTIMQWVQGSAGARLGLMHAPAGHGKTIFVERLARRLLDRARADPTVPIPLLVRFAEHRGIAAIEDLCHHVLDQIGRGDVPGAALKDLIRRGRVVLLFDGLDELSEEVGERTSLENIKTLADLIHLDSEGRVFVTCRSTFLETRRQVMAPLLASGHELWQLLPFDDDDQLRFLEQNPPDGVTGADVNRHRDRVVSFLNQHPIVAEFATSPFLLKQISFAVAQKQTALPKNMSEVYEGFLTSLCERELVRQQHEVPAGRQMSFLRRLAHEMVYEQAYAYSEDLFELIIAQEFDDEIRKSAKPEVRRKELIAKLTGHAAFAPLPLKGSEPRCEVQFLHESMRDYCAASHLVGLLDALEPDSAVARSALCRRTLPEGVLAFMCDALDSRRLSALGQVAHRTPPLMDNQNLFRIATTSTVPEAPSIAFPFRRCVGLNLRDLIVQDASLHEFAFDKSDLTGSMFISCDLRACDFRSATLMDARFFECDMGDAQFANSHAVNEIDDLKASAGADLSLALLDHGAVVGGERRRPSRESTRSHDAAGLVLHVARKFYKGAAPVNAQRRVREIDVLERGRAGEERVLIRERVVPGLESAGILERLERGSLTLLSVAKAANAEVINFVFRGAASDRIAKVIREVDARKSA